VLDRGLAIDPRARWATVRELSEALRDGARRRLRRVAAGLLAAAAVAVVAVGVARRADRAAAVAACTRAAQAVAETWPGPGGASKDRLRDSFAASGKAYAQVTLEKVVPRLDEWASGWSVVRERTCLAAEVDGSLSPALYERATDCLAERREQLAGLIAAFSMGDGSAVSRAVTAVSSLQRSERCEDERLLALRSPLPEELREQVVHLRSEVARAAGLLESGAYKEGQVLADALIEQVDANAYAPLRA
jgi:hypothetical protein